MRRTTPKQQTRAAMEVSREVWWWADRSSKSLRVVWCGMTWRGVPRPVRWKLGLILIGAPMQGKLPGCGCLDRLKRVAEWLDARGWWPVGWLEPGD